jgi:hypothetical protein
MMISFYTEREGEKKKEENKCKYIEENKSKYKVILL